MVVGGSGLYIRAVIEGLVLIPPASPELRHTIENEIDKKGIAALISELAQVDPAYAAKVGPRDHKRLVRALEVYRLTGKPFSWWHQSSHSAQCSLRNSRASDNYLIYGLNRPRLELHSLIERRVEAMLKAGWMEEVRCLIDRYGSIANLPAPVLEVIGCRQITRCLAGEIPLEEARRQIVIATRQFAKRQLTWFRADKRIEWLEQSGDDAPEHWANAIIGKFG